MEESREMLSTQQLNVIIHCDKIRPIRRDPFGGAAAAAVVGGGGGGNDEEEEEEVEVDVDASVNWTAMRSSER